MPKIRGSIFDTPGRTPISSDDGGRSNSAVAAPHQGDAVLDQADNSAAKIMALPGAAPNPLLAEQAFGNFTIAMSLQPCIEGSHRQI